jgi:hypothetical protein
MTESFSFQPPLIARWLIDLFATPEQAESILGDLLEEFSDLASKSGVASARRWYWWQSVRTIAHLFHAEFRGGPPWAIGSVLVGFFFMNSFFVGFLEWATLANCGQNVFACSQLPADFVWMKNELLRLDLVLSFSIGCIVSAAAKGREMVTAITLGLILGVWSTVLFLVWSASHHYALLLLPLLMTFAASILIVLGGVIVRQIRMASARRATPG